MKQTVYRTMTFDEKKNQLALIDIEKDRKLAENTFYNTWNVLIKKLPKSGRMNRYYKDCISQLVSYNVKIVRTEEVVNV
jgi:hypothetical protein